MGHKMFMTSDMSTDDQLIRATQDCPMASLLWPYFIVHCDDWGRMEASVHTIKARCFPMLDMVTLEVIETALQTFAHIGIITLYTIGDKRYFAIPPTKWWKYQTHIHHHKRVADGSRIPPPPVEPTLQTPSVKHRASARKSAKVRDTTRDFIPSPSLSPSPSTTATTRVRAQEETTQDDNTSPIATVPMAASCAAIAQKAHMASDADVASVVAKYQPLWPDAVLIDQAERFDRWAQSTHAPRTANTLDSFFARIKTPAAHNTAQPRASPDVVETIEIPADVDPETAARMRSAQLFLRATKPKRRSSS